MTRITIHWDISDIWDENIDPLINFINSKNIRLFGDYHTDNYWRDLYITLEDDYLTIENINIVDKTITGYLNRVRTKQQRAEDQE